MMAMTTNSSIKVNARRFPWEPKICKSIANNQFNAATANKNPSPPTLQQPIGAPIQWSDRFNTDRGYGCLVTRCPTEEP